MATAIDTQKPENDTSKKINNPNDEEIFAQDNGESPLRKKSNDQNNSQNNEPTYSSIEFDKHQLFFHSLPNKMAYDTVTIKNVGKTCIYYQWQKNTSSFQLEDKKSDGIDRFFCHYGDDKIFPDEEREFTFSFFSEKNGVFSEEWILVTTPPLKNCDLNIHLSGLVHKYEDLYSKKINDLNTKIENNANNTKINEFVLDLIDTIKEQTPPLPNMLNQKIFSYYFQLYNQEYNVEFSKRVMDNLNKLNNTVMNEILGIKEEEEKKVEPPPQVTTTSKNETPIATEESKAEKKNNKKNVGKKKEEPKVVEEEPPKVEEEPKKVEIDPKENEFFFPKNENEEKKFWNGSLDLLKERINLVKDEEKKFDFMNKFNCILHIAHKKGPEDSTVYDFVKKIFLEQLENFNETSNKIREEMVLPPYTFDLLTKQSLSPADLEKYEAELKKKKDDFAKRNKKKPPAKGEEDKDEMEVYRQKLSKAVSENILEKINDIGKSKAINEIKDDVLKANILNENYLDRLSRIKTFQNVKTEGGFDNKYVVLRVDIEECKRNYEDDVDDDGNVTGSHLKDIDFLRAKEKILQSLSFLLNNGVRVVLLLVDFGPKIGSVNNDYSVKDLTGYIETNLEHPAFFCKNLTELEDYNKKIDDEELKDNCCIVMENINFFPEECGAENFQEEIVNPTGKEKSLSLYQKKRFLNQITNKANIFVNDSIFSFDKYTPTVIDINAPLKILGVKIQEQLKKIIDFFNIDNKEYMLIMGDNDIFRVRGRNQANSSNNKKKEEEQPKNEGNTEEEGAQKAFVQENILDDGTVGGTEILDYSDETTMITNLLIINSIMHRFKKIFIFGKLALQFIQFIRHDYDIFDTNLYHINENIFKLMKYILVKAYLLKIEIILPDDFKILNKEEFKKHLEPFVDSNGTPKDYTKEIKFLLKRERIQRKLEATYTDPEELAENADYQRVKLEPEQIEHLKLYKEDTVQIDRMPYCYDFISEFERAQGIETPKKIFKTTLEEYNFNANVYDKEIVYTPELLEANEHNIEKLKKYREKLANMAAENNENDENSKEKNSEKSKKENEEANNSKNVSKHEKTEENKTEENKKENKTEENKTDENKNEENKPEEQKEPKKVKKYDPRLYDYEKMELVDFGEHTYNQLLENLENMHGVMWFGRLSPSKCENMFDNYIKIINAINARKKQLKEKFEEEQAIEEKKLLETDLKARKQLLNIFLKGKSTYETIKDNYKSILNGQANPDELGEEDEGGQDEEQFSHDMHALIDYYIDDDFELINSILKGKHISGFYGLDKDELVEKEEEFDPKTIEEITN